MDENRKSSLKAISDLKRIIGPGLTDFYNDEIEHYNTLTTADAELEYRITKAMLLAYSSICTKLFNVHDCNTPFMEALGIITKQIERIGEIHDAVDSLRSMTSATKFRARGTK